MDNRSRNNTKKYEKGIEFVVILFLSFIIIVCCNKFVFNECSNSIRRICQRMNLTKDKQKKDENLHARDRAMKVFMQKGIAIGKPIATGMPIKEAVFYPDEE